MNQKTENTEELEELGPWMPSPAERLEKGFQQILETRMKGLPFVHPNVGVHAVGFQKWSYFWWGIMVTPWAINAILTEGVPEKWKSVPEGVKLHYEFPAGLYDFISVKDAILGEYKMCSLLSPLDEIKDDAMAIEVAELAIKEFLKDEAPEEEGTPIHYSPNVPDPEAISKAIEKNLSKPVGRRSFFRRKKIEDEQ